MTVLRSYIDLHQDPDPNMKLLGLKALDLALKLRAGYELRVRVEQPPPTPNMGGDPILELLREAEKTDPPS